MGAQGRSQLATIPFWLRDIWNGTPSTPFVALKICHRVEPHVDNIPLPIVYAAAYVIAHKTHSVPWIHTYRALRRVARHFSLDVTQEKAQSIECQLLTLLCWQVPPCEDTVGGKLDALLMFDTEDRRRCVFRLISRVLCNDFSPERLALSDTMLATICITSRSTAEAKAAIFMLGSRALKLMQSQALV